MEQNTMIAKTGLNGNAIKETALNVFEAAGPRSIDADRSYLPINIPSRCNDGRLHSSLSAHFASYDDCVSIRRLE